jgi:hypothetical protein
MATVNVYLPEELKTRLEGHADLNLSAIARDCWERELALADIPAGEVRAEAWDGAAWVDLKFQGSLLTHSSFDGSDLYLTAGGELVFVPGGEERYWVQGRGEVDADDLLAFFGRDDEAYGMASAALGLRRIIEL